MPPEITVSEKIIKKVTVHLKSRDLKSPIQEQIEYWARLGQTIEANPDLPIEFIKGVFKGIDEVENGHVSPFNLENHK